MTTLVEVEWLISQLPEQLRTIELRQALMAPGIVPLWQRMGTLINAQESTGAIGTVFGSVTQHNADVGGDYAARDVIKNSIIAPIIIAGSGLAGQSVDAAGVATTIANVLDERVRRIEQQQTLVAIGARAGWSDAALTQTLAAVSYRTPLPAAANATERFARIIAVLDLYRGQGDSLLRFVTALAQHVADPVVAKDLQAWIASRGAQEAPVVPVAGAQAEAPPTPAVMVAVDPVKGEEKPYRMRAWLWLGVGQVIPLHMNTQMSYDMKDLPDLLSEWRRRALKQIGSGSATQLRFEFFLPNKLLAQAVHSCEVRVDTGSIDDEGDEEEELPQIGVEHSVVVRPRARGLARINNEDGEPDSEAVLRRQRWKEKWYRLAQPTSTEPALFFPDEKPASITTYQANLSGELLRPEIVGYAETDMPPDDLDLARAIFRFVIRCGVPAGIWFGAGAERSADTYQKVDELLAVGPLRDLPTLVLDRRRRSTTATFGRALVLFWDDPERLPYDPDESDLHETEQA